MTIKELQDGFYRVFRESYSWRQILRRTFRSIHGIPFRLGMNYNYRQKARRMPDPDQKQLLPETLPLPAPYPVPGLSEK